MQSSVESSRVWIVGFIAAVALAACADHTLSKPVAPTIETKAVANAFTQRALIGDAAERGAPTIDPNLQEPWGIAFSRSGVLWVANTHSGTSTLYDTTGARLSRVIEIPGGSPTGIVSNGSTDFAIDGGPASWIYAGEYGAISAWNSAGGARIVIDNRGRSFYKGLAMASSSSGNRLYAANFSRNQVEMYDASFKFIGAFTDSTLPPGYAPFGIQNVGGKLIVTFAKQLGPSKEDDDPGVGNGYVDIFTADGALERRFASQGTLNSPWGIAVAPEGYGPFAGDILIGNFGDGRISAYDQNGRFVDVLRDENQAPVSIGGLWGIAFAPGSKALYFTSCPAENTSGVIGTLIAK